jgi:transcriptional regulator with XRE-family HTH domain
MKSFHTGTLSAWKKGQVPSAYTICNLAKFLGTATDFLLTGEEPDDLAQEGRELLGCFKQLEQRDRDEIIGIINLKLKSTKEDKLSGKPA